MWTEAAATCTCSCSKACFKVWPSRFQAWFKIKDSCFKNQGNSILFFLARSCLWIVFFFSLLPAIVIHNSLYMITTYFLRSQGRLASCQSEERGTRIRVWILADPRRIPPGEWPTGRSSYRPIFFFLNEHTRPVCFYWYSRKNIRI